MRGDAILSSVRITKKYYSIFRNSFFENMNIDVRIVLGIIAKYSAKIPRNIIEATMGVLKKTVIRIIDMIIDLMPVPNFNRNKLSGPGKIVQIDETMLNFKSKSHRGRSPANKTDALCIIEFSNSIERVFATCIENKSANTILPIICEQVRSGSLIHTDDAKVYKGLTKKGLYTNQWYISTIL